MWQKQLACIWPYSSSPLGPLIWTPALFFFFLLFCCHTRRLFWGWREWGRGPRGPAADTAGSAEVGAAGWCQRFKYSHQTELGWAKIYGLGCGCVCVGGVTSQEAAICVHLSVVKSVPHKHCDILQNFPLCCCERPTSYYSTSIWRTTTKKQTWPFIWRDLICSPTSSHLRAAAHLYRWRLSKRTATESEAAQRETCTLSWSLQFSAMFWKYLQEICLKFIKWSMH